MKYRNMLISLLLFVPVVAISASPPSGFGVADWGMDRNEIIASEGAPNAVGDTDGYLMYFEKEVLGKKASVVYKFEQGCTALKNSKCVFSDGYYGFHDGSKQFSEELENTLTEKYGPPDSVKKETYVMPNTGYVTKGKEATEKTIYTRTVGQVKIEHTSTYNLYDYTDITGEAHKAGPLRNFVHYYGPYHHKIDKNKKKSGQRGL